jgi:hypothetical protein
MSNSEWKFEYLNADNLKTGKAYYHSGDGDEEFMVQNGLVLDNADKFILSDKVCAKEFLNQLKDGHIDLYNQTRLLKTLNDLYQLCRYNSLYKSLEPLFFETMVSLRDHIDAHFESHGFFAEDEDSNLGMHYDYGGYIGFINECLIQARYRAVKSMIKTFATQYSNPEGYKGDLYGECWITLEKPQHIDLIKYLPGEYSMFGQPNAVIKNQGHHEWKLSFIGLSLYSNRLILDRSALEGATEFLSKQLDLKASVFWYLTD